MVCLFCRSVPGDATTLNIKVGGRGELQVCWIRSQAKVVQKCFLQQSSMKRAVVDVLDERRACRAWLAWRAWQTWPTSCAAPPPHLARFAHLDHNRKPSADQIARAAQHIQLICALRYRQIAGSSSPGQTAPEKHRSALAGDPERAPPPLGGASILAMETGSRHLQGRAPGSMCTMKGALVARGAPGSPGARGRLVAHWRTCRTRHTWRTWRAWQICASGLPHTPGVPGASCQLGAPSAQSRSASEKCCKPIVNQQ